MQRLFWNDLTASEREAATEQYLAIRESEEGRARDEMTEEYPEPIDAAGVERCTFYRETEWDGETNVCVMI